MALFFVLLVFIVLPRFFPAEWQTGLAKVLTSENLGRNLLLLSPLIVFTGYKILNRVHTILLDRHTPLSIV